MDDDLDLRHFSHRCRLFPLPNVVLFPHAVLPLHIFEPRYRQMAEDAVADDGFVTIVQYRNPTRGTVDALGYPPIETVACLGRILQHERLPDGRFNFLLLGRKRVRLLREVSAKKLYRVAEVEVLEDVDVESPGPYRSELNRLFRMALERQGSFDNELMSLLDSKLPLGVLCDIIGHALGLPPEMKQSLLGEVDVMTRVDFLVSLLRKMAAVPYDPTGDRPGFPPPFSLN